MVLLAFPSAASAEILITFMRYNPPGADTVSNASRDKEYVTIHNDGGLAKVLTDWRLHDNQHHRFTFPAFSLCGGCSVRVHTGSGTTALTTPTSR
ncbi:MAG TPA: lamin tail domain-containing protein [Gaiellales bacterium]|nr:lamin tail domain-containing protein [Gaiellales bacterium]